MIERTYQVKFYHNCISRLFFEINCSTPLHALSNHTFLKVVKQKTTASAVVALSIGHKPHDFKVYSPHKNGKVLETFVKHYKESVRNVCESSENFLQTFVIELNVRLVKVSKTFFNCFL